MSNQIDINLLEEDFSEFIYNHVFSSNEEIIVLNKLLEKTDVLIFGGLIKDFLLFKKNNQNNEITKIDFKDIDIVLPRFDDETAKILNDYLERENVFGGFKLKINDNKYDIWSFQNTWAIKNSSQLYFDLECILPGTSFFNSTAIIFSVKRNRFIYENKVNDFYQKGILDVVYNINPFPELCIVKSFDYLKNYNINLSEGLIDYILCNFKVYVDKLESVQLKYYGNVRYNLVELNDFYKNLRNCRKGKKPNVNKKLDYELISSLF